MRAEADWAALFGAFGDGLDWILDRAGAFARAFPEEVAAVERVRAFARARAAGEVAHARVDDVLFVLGLAAGAIVRAQQPARPRLALPA